MSLWNRTTPSFDGNAPNNHDGAAELLRGIIEAQDFTKGLEYIDEISGKFPDSGELQFYCGVIKFYSGDKVGGTETFIKSAKLGDLEARRLLYQDQIDWSDGKIRELIEQAVSLKRSGDFSKAESLLIKLNTEYPYHAGISMSLGKVKACLGYYEEAIDLLNKAADMYEEYGMESEAWQYRDQVKTLANRSTNHNDFISYMKSVAANPEFEPKIEPLDAKQDSELENLIERTPPSGPMDLFLTKLIKDLKTDSRLTRIYGGYNQIEKPIKSGFEMMSMGLMGFEEEEINSCFERGKSPFRTFIAIPIDEMDDLIENPAMNDWGFEEQYLKKYVTGKTIPVGARNEPDSATKLRTIVFIVEV
jgi:tetratricopeptide (TPR) repeat protein